MQLRLIYTRPVRALPVLLLATSLLTGCAPSESAQHDHHVTSPTIAVDGAIPATYGGTSLNSPLPSNVLQLPFVDHKGNSFTLSDFADKTVVLTNFLTSCQDTGPLTSTNFFAASRALSSSAMSDKVVFIEITVDAEVDTSARLSAYRDVYGFDSNVLLATSDAKTLETLWNYFGVPATRHALSPQEIAENPHDWQTGAPSAYHWMHANIVALIDVNSTWRWMQSGAPDIEAHELPKKMQDFLNANGVTLSTTHDEFSWRVSQVVSAIEDVMGHSINS